jgi:hypothetical protein
MDGKFAQSRYPLKIYRKATLVIFLNGTGIPTMNDSAALTYKISASHKLRYESPSDDTPSVKLDLPIEREILEYIVSSNEFLSWPILALRMALQKNPEVYGNITEEGHVTIMNKVREYWLDQEWDLCQDVLLLITDTVRMGNEALRHVSLLTDVFREVLLSPIGTLSHETMQSVVFDIIMVIVGREPRLFDTFHFAVRPFLNAIGSGNSFGDRLRAFRFFGNLDPDLFFKILPEDGIPLIADSFVELALADDDDEFMGLICEVVLFWKNRPAYDISLLISYLETLDSRNAVELILDLYYDVELTISSEMLIFSEKFSVEKFR